MESTRSHILENTRWKKLWTSFQKKNFAMNVRHEINGLHYTGQPYNIETHSPTNTSVTLTASVLSFVKCVQANATIADSSISSFPLNSRALANQLEVCFELL
jgi:hypothetical protein